jgi:hypothetical protein
MARKRTAAYVWSVQMRALHLSKVHFFTSQYLLHNVWHKCKHSEVIVVVDLNLFSIPCIAVRRCRSFPMIGFR